MAHLDKSVLENVKKIMLYMHGYRKKEEKKLEEKSDNKKEEIILDTKKVDIPQPNQPSMMEIDDEDIFADSGSYITTKTTASVGELAKQNSYFGDKKDDLNDIKKLFSQIPMDNKKLNDIGNDNEDMEEAEEEKTITKRTHTVIQVQEQGPSLPSDVDMDAYPEPEEYPNTDDQYNDSVKNPLPSEEDKLHVVKIETDNKLSLLEERARGLTSVFKRDDNALRREKLDSNTKEKAMDPRYVDKGSYEECYPGVYETAQYKRPATDGGAVVYSSSDDSDEDSDEDNDDRDNMLRNIHDTSQPKVFQLMERSYIEGARNTRKRKVPSREKKDLMVKSQKLSLKPKAKNLMKN